MAIIQTQTTKCLTTEELVEILKQEWEFLKANQFKYGCGRYKEQLKIVIDVLSVIDWLKDQRNFLALDQIELSNAFICIFRDFKVQNPGITLFINDKTCFNQGRTLEVTIVMNITPSKTKETQPKGAGVKV